MCAGVGGLCAGLRPGAAAAAARREQAAAAPHLNHAALSRAAGRKQPLSEPPELQLLAAEVPSTSRGILLLNLPDYLSSTATRRVVTMDGVNGNTESADNKGPPPLPLICSRCSLSQ